MSDEGAHRTRHAGADNLPDRRLAEDGGSTDCCRECGRDLEAGYLCDDCDTVGGWP